MPVLLLLTFLFAAIGVFVFLALMLMLVIGLNGMSSAAAQPWLIGVALTIFVGFNLLAGLLLSVIARRSDLRGWSWLAASCWSALAFLAQLGLAALLWQLA
ncbi:hypothetical protein DFR29_11277 [Tahibacter aquaticus]|uniref:Uncharacterized protein n=1 Tax=Tahibacter aquaticus TaxID=520092 RepID=A0A4R6YS01_9GAMM|nr:hypothetical protein [Tahibacter aquaticus]TDR40763.1 hypothetical protein DFR29_11277 [Tahibacter aquaticus]